MTAPGTAGLVVHDWPPTGPNQALWALVDHTTDEDKHTLLALLRLWRDDTSTLVAIEDDDGRIVDVDWTEPTRWMGAA